MWSTLTRFDIFNVWLRDGVHLEGVDGLLVGQSLQRLSVHLQDLIPCKDKTIVGPPRLQALWRPAPPPRDTETPHLAKVKDCLTQTHAEHAGIISLRWEDLLEKTLGTNDFQLFC